MTETVTNNERSGVVTKLPSDVQQVGVVAKYDVLKYLRSRRLVGMLAIEALVLVLITALPPLLGHDYNKDPDGFVSTYVGFVNLLVIIGATLFAGDAIVSEYQGRTGYLLFPNPIKKWVLLAGKFISSVGAMLLMLLIYYGAALVLGLAITGNFSTLGVESLLLAMLYAIAALAVGYLISSIMKGSTGALILTFALFLFIFSIIDSVLGQFGGVKPWFMITFAGEVVTNIMTVPYPVDSTQTLPIGTGQSLTVYNYVPDVGASIAVMIVWAVVALGLAYYFFRRREMSA